MAVADFTDGLDVKKLGAILGLEDEVIISQSVVFGKAHGAQSFKVSPCLASHVSIVGLDLRGFHLRKSDAFILFINDARRGDRWGC